jgi:hypothetical protein
MRLVGTGKKLRRLASAAGASQKSRTRSAGVLARSYAGQNRIVRFPHGLEADTVSAGEDARAPNSTAGMLALTSKRLTTMIDGLWKMTRQERAEILAIPQEDADAVLTGAITLEAVLQQFGFEVLHTSHSSLRNGAILKSFRERQKAALRKSGGNHE